MSNSTDRNPWMISTLVLAGFVLGFGVAQIPGFQIGTAAQTTTLTGKQAPAPSAPAAETPTVLSGDQIAKLVDDDPVFGDPNAPVTIVEFSDYQCPYCAKFFKLSLPQIEENYIKTGKVKFVYRDFPLDFHAQALPAALAAECSRDQAKYREMHDMLFSQQVEWAGNPKAEELMKGYAKQLGLDTKTFNECIASNKYALEIRKDLVDGASVGVSGTPGFFINGKLLSGAMPYEEVFKPIIEAELAGKTWELQYDPSGRPSINVE